MARTALVILGSIVFLAQQACITTGGDPSAERFGKTIYLDGAGNWGFGAAEIPKGLKQAGYQGDVEIYIWTTSLMPLTDQLNIPAAKMRARALAKRIAEYRNAYPENKVNLIALSAGTGVATWAVERLNQETKIDNLILLSSSLSHDYDIRKALRNIQGKVYVYHSPHDAVLNAVYIIGTIDGKRGVKCVGQVGLEVPPGFESRIENIPWSRKYIPLGWTGAHTDVTSEDFVRAVLSKHVVADPTQTAGKYTHTIITTFPMPTPRTASAATATPSEIN